MYLPLIKHLKRWKHSTLRLDQLKHEKRLTFIATLRILRIRSKPGNKLTVIADIRVLNVYNINGNDITDKYFESEVQRFLQSINLENYWDKFDENNFHKMEELKDLTINDLKEMGIDALRDRKEIYKAIQSRFANKNEILDDEKYNDIDV